MSKTKSSGALSEIIAEGLSAKQMNMVDMEPCSVTLGISDELRWFNECRFGMFVHFGLYSLLERGEWAQNTERIPRSEYEKLMRDFNPFHFNADEWVRVARSAGAKYITVTTKHHDGFCLFDSALTDYKITNTPFGRDLIGELVAACHRDGMRIILYYSPPDWHHPNFVPNKLGADLAGYSKEYLWEQPATDRPDWSRYLAYMFGQVEELCTKYGQIDGIWFDGTTNEERWHGKELYQLIKKHHPHAVVNCRAGHGDYFTPERDYPEDLAGYLFEVCDAISATSWCYERNPLLRSTPFFIKNLIKIAASGGNYLLNVGPAPDGTITEGYAVRMREIGAWLKRYGEAIYGAEAGPTMEDNLRATRNGTRLFVHLLDWPDTDQIVVPRLSQEDVHGARLLGDGRPLRVLPHAQGLALGGLPSLPSDPLPGVIQIDMKRVSEAVIRKPVMQETMAEILVREDAVTELRAEQAERYGRDISTGSRLGLAGIPGQVGDFKLYWKMRHQKALWRVKVPQGGSYAVSVFCTGGGADLICTIGGHKLDVMVPEVPNTGYWQVMREIPLGEVKLQAGSMMVEVCPGKKLAFGHYCVDVQKVVLRLVTA